MQSECGESPSVLPRSGNAPRGERRTERGRSLTLSTVRWQRSWGCGWWTLSPGPSWWPTRVWKNRKVTGGGSPSVLSTLQTCWMDEW